jgi:hypothetical protein
MLKRFITYLFLGAFLFHAASRMIIQMNFWLNQTYIAENLCENRAKPQMECDGKCHLKKELKKDDERKQKDNKQQVEIFLFFSPSQPFQSDSDIDFDELDQHLVFERTEKTNGFHSSIYHPPSC